MTNFAHHFLLPTPQMSDPRFAGSLLYLCRHSHEGTWGFIINQPNTSISVGGLLQDMRIDADKITMHTPAMNGGPIRPEAGFVLHTGLPNFRSSFAISENVCLTTSRDILPLLAHHERLSHYMLLMGFCTWQQGQLQEEIQAGDWLTCPAKIDIIFEPDHSQKLSKAYQLLGVNPDKLAPTIGIA
ncbi:MAG: YqgE/AlgH family protein [Moraxella sp.]|nr:YqgE/AlgH family protein [Moraxella sp.]